MAIPIIGDLIKGVTDIVSKVIPDADKRNEINLELAKLADDAQSRLDAQMTAQTDINKIEAQSSNVFVAGWRPFIGWVGGVGLAYSSIGEPLMEFVAKTIFKYGGVFPVLNTEILLQVLMAILGLGVMRSYEKVQGVDTTSIRTTNVPISTPIKKDEPASSADPPPSKHFHIF